LRRMIAVKGTRTRMSSGFRSLLATTPRRQVGQACPMAKPSCRGHKGRAAAAVAGGGT
jgi:hypothetical protein